jgi:hypothetical protein
MLFQFLNAPADIEWLFDVHLSDYPLWRDRTKSFILYGNEDCPQRVELFESSDPTVSEKPFMIHAFRSDERRDN